MTWAPRNPAWSKLHRIVDPVRAPAEQRYSAAEICAAVQAMQPAHVADVLSRHGLNYVWLDGVERRLRQERGELDVWRGLPAELSGELARRRRAAVVRCMLQERGLAVAAAALDDAGLRHLTFKGLHVAQTVYESPLSRPSWDVDLLVGEPDKRRAIAALREAGFSARCDLESSGREMPLVGHGITLDLHWELLRPGRSRISLGQWALERAAPFGSSWAPDDTANLVVLVLHTAITEHVSGRLVRALDIDRWIRARSPDWDEAERIFGESRLRTAAWLMLGWTRHWFDSPIPDSLMAALAPGGARRAYLRSWLSRDPATLYSGSPKWVRAGFSLALHDRPADVARALGGLRRGEGSRRRMLAAEAGFAAAYLRRALATGGTATLRMSSGSMRPLAPAGSRVRLRPVAPGESLVGSIVAVGTGDRVIVHRVVEQTDAVVTTRGIASTRCDPPCALEQVIGVVSSVEGVPAGERSLKWAATIFSLTNHARRLLLLGAVRASRARAPTRRTSPVKTVT